MRHFRNVEIIHALVETYAPGAALAALLMRKKLVMTLHGTYSVPPRGWSRYSLLLRFAYRIAAHTTTGSFGTEEKVRAAGAHLPRCEFIPNGVDEKIFHFDDLPREDFMLTVGEIKPRKGADLGVRALVLLKDEFPNLVYKIVGHYGENGFVETIRSLAREGGVEDRVEFTGRLEDPELVSLYNRCRAFILAARDTGLSFEGFPMVYYEANMCGAPVVTTTGFGSEYAVKTDINGYLVPPEDPEAIAASIRDIMTDGAKARRLSEGARMEAGKHTWDAIAPQLMNFYRSA
jgi:glycosyltransferase involved in cell wall biosynthesis